MTGVARWISIAFHPFVSTVVLIAAAVLRVRGGNQSWTIIAVIAAIAVIPILALILTASRSGRWKNVDASRPAERPLLFAISLGVVAVMVVVLLLWSPATFLARGTLAAGAMLATSWALLRWIKVSLHVAFAAYAAMALLLVSRPLAIVFFVAIPFVAWARLEMTRHGLGEVVVGAIIGILAGAALIATG